MKKKQNKGLKVKNKNKNTVKASWKKSSVISSALIMWIVGQFCGVSVEFRY